MKKQYLTGLAILVLVAVGVVIYKKHSTQTPTPLQPVSQRISSATTSSVTITPATLSASVVESAWTVFQTYLQYAKNQDIDGLKTVAYQLSATCKDPAQRDACNKLMVGAYTAGSILKQSDFTVVWYDSKQIILETLPATHDSDNNVSMTYGVIYFARNPQGDIKVLSFNPAQGAALAKNGKTVTQLQPKLASMIKDTDQDGLADDTETCSDPGAILCHTTDPNKRDTDGDGWWDGIQILFQKS